MDDVASARLSFASGLSANLVCLYSAPYTNRFVIHGTDATVSVIGVAPESEDDRPVFEIVWASGEIQRKAVPYVDTLAIQLQMFAQAIRGRGRPAVCGEQGGSNVAVLDAVTRSAQASGDKQIVEYGPFRPICAQEG
jgi:predicted dehydrogenase